MLNAANRQGLNARATGLAAAINIGLNLVLILLYRYLTASTTAVLTEAGCAFSGGGSSTGSGLNCGSR